MEFEAQIKKNLLKNCNYKGETLLLAVSGGSDSMALLHALYYLNYEVVVAHCNFNLRGEDSYEDLAAVKNFCEENDIECLVKDFDTNNLKEKGESIQMLARKLRYEWFAELLAEGKAEFLVTAHHEKDMLETFFVNAFRGNGLQGLKSIPFRVDNILRPMLNISKEGVLAYIEEFQIPYRNDVSNEDVKYTRNKIRLNVLPNIDTEFPHSLPKFAQSIRHLQDSNEVELSWYKEQLALANVEEKSWGIQLRCDALIGKPALMRVFLNRFLSGKAFSFDQIAKMADSRGEKAVVHFDSKNWSLFLKNSLVQIVERKTLEPQQFTYNSVEELKEHPLIELSETFNKQEFSLSKDDAIAQFDLDKLTPPFSIGNVKDGEKFTPFGMNKRRLVNDFLKDEKTLPVQKKLQTVLRDANGVVWVVGKRISNTCKVDESTNNFLILRTITAIFD